MDEKLLAKAKEAVADAVMSCDDCISSVTFTADGLVMWTVIEPTPLCEVKVTTFTYHDMKHLLVASSSLSSGPA